MQVSRFLCFLPISLLLLSGCVSSVPSPTTHTASTTVPLANSMTDAWDAPGPSVLQSERLAQLWQERTQGRPITEPPLGPGDVLEISVPAIAELKDRTVRISGEGTIALPFVGVVQASGMNDEALSLEIRRRLTTYMYHPQVSLFVREYRSRHVAVIGAVAKPGLYTLASGADSVLSMLAAAGGTTTEAASHILFLPAESRVNERLLTPPTLTRSIRRVSMETMPVPMETMPVPMRQAEPLVIDLQALHRGEQQQSLTLPARPGDVILVPNAGQVLVEGWVEKPGAYKITPELTVLGAVAAAGGPQFPADTTAVKVIRAGRGDGKVVLLADLGSIKRGTEPDIPVRAGDVIEVSSSTAKLVPYGFYRFFSAILNVGVGASVPLR